MTTACALLMFFMGNTQAATDPVYSSVGANGKVMLSNSEEHPGARLMLAANTEETWAFRKRFRLLQDVGAEIPRRSRQIKQVAPEIASMIEAAAARAGLSADLVKAVVLVESGFRPSAQSSAGAIGLMQVIPATGRRFGVSNLHDPASNLYAGTTYLAYLLKYFKGDVRLALAGYNAGEGAVIKHGYRIPPYAETQAYVPAVLSAWRSFNERQATANDPKASLKSP
jgi:soluble lytic murein transglycosylase-like protein